MKRLLLVLFLCLTLVTVIIAPVISAKGDGNTIQSGLITDSNGNVITVGYDKWGYNYQAHMFNGFYGNFSRPATPVTEGDMLVMKWNDAWMSNMDRDGDGKLDRHYGCPSYIGSGAWLTNHQWGVNPDGTKWDYFCKIVAVPADANCVAGIWYAADGTEIGPSIWGAFATIQEVYTDPSTGDHGIYSNAPAPTGFGYYIP